MAGQPKSASAAQAGRAALLERLLVREIEVLRAVARSNSENEADADDAFQNGCVSFIRFYEGGDKEAFLWLRLVIKRFAWQIGNERRRRGSVQHVVSVEPGELTGLEIVLVDERAGTEELVERAEALEERIALLEELKPDERTTLILIGLGATYSEIAELRGWSHTKVNRCASEGRARLRELAERGEKS
jgi:RNA polymerase sigma factor (sigma-70 family)